MTFIESWLGLSPDGGNGMTELAIFGLLAVVIAAALYHLKRKA